MMIMKVLLPVDGSDCSNETMKWVSNTFDKENTQYFLISVIPIVMDFPLVDDTMSATTEVLRLAKKRMEEYGCRVQSAEQMLGYPGSQICYYAEQIDADMVVIGSHGHSGLSRLMLGSVSENVLEHCKKSVIVYKHAKQSEKLSNPDEALNINNSAC